MLLPPPFRSTQFIIYSHPTTESYFIYAASLNKLRPKETDLFEMKYKDHIAVSFDRIQGTPYRCLDFSPIWQGLPVFLYFVILFDLLLENTCIEAVFLRRFCSQTPFEPIHTIRHLSVPSRNATVQ